MTYPIHAIGCMWLANVTAESSSVAASTIHPTAKDISSPSPADLESVAKLEGASIRRHGWKKISSTINMPTSLGG